MSRKTRKCAFGCQSYRALFSLPKEEPTRHKWLDFLSGIPHLTSVNTHLCDRHFTHGCLANLGLYQSGWTQRLSLITGAIPTVNAPDGDASTSQEAPILTGYTPPVRSVGVQTTATPVFTRTVSTQLSAGTLKLHHVRSKGAQIVPTTTEKSSETQQHCLDLSSTPIKSTGVGCRPSKRPRLEEEEDVEDMEDMDISDVTLPHDSTYEPGASATAASILEESEVIDKEPSALKDAKYIVFESSLREIFDNCPVCKSHCRVQRRKCGTLVSFTQKCPQCRYSRRWQSGPVIGSSPVGNIQLSAAVYFSGGSFVKVARICNAMNIQIHQYNSFRRHCHWCLEPAIFHKWTRDQKRLLEDLKTKGKVALTGDMRADSPGHKAKFGTYTLMDVKSEKVVDMKLVQSNGVGGSYHMEKEGLHRSLNFLEQNGLEIDYIVTDRHLQIQKYLSEREITHYYDVRHVVKGLSKKLEKISKDKECQVVKKWSGVIKNHMFWTASSSTSGPEKVAKWTSLINHIQDVHTHHDPLFPKCTHPDKVSRDPKEWFHSGTSALYKVEKLMANKRVLSDVAKLSSYQQTSALESFQRTILRFTPKTSDFEYVGMMCRHFLAAMHQNENATRKQALYKTSYPKYREGQGTAKPIKTKTTYGYAAALMRLVFDEVLPDPSKFVAQLKAVPVPKDLCAEFEKASKEDIVTAHVSRFSREVAGPHPAHQHQHQNAETPHSDLQDLETPGGSGGQHTLE